MNAVRPLGRWRWLVILGCPLLGAVLYLGWAWIRSGAAGYPIDDAWIHQTYARSLAVTGEMTFNPGEPSAGMTSPAWAALLAPGHWLQLPVAWSYVLGTVSLMLCGWLTWRLARRLFPTYTWAPWLATATVVLEWHLVWAAVSGMETLFFTACTLALIEFYHSTRHTGRTLYAVGLGILGGVLYLIRPEGVLLVGLIGLDLLRLRRWRDLLIMGVVWLAVISPSVWLNWQATGSPLPDTFTAKAVYVAGSGWLGRLLFVPLAALAFWAGSLLIILPFALWGSWRALGSDWRRHWLSLAWPLGLVLLYTLRLPVLYHHARYLMPIIPWLALYGAAGLLSIGRRRRRHFLVAVHILVLLIFWVQGANIYSWNVDNINRQQVAIGRWLSGSTPRETVVAAQDVGAIGYFGGRRLVDLEGLITPEINKLQRSGTSPVDFLHQEGVSLLVLYGESDKPWLAELELTPVYTATLDLNTISASEQMIIYDLEWSKN